MSERDFDLIVWGATGFTGQLVAAYLAQTYGVEGPLRWPSPGATGANWRKCNSPAWSAAQREMLPMVIADSADADSLASMAQPDQGHLHHRWPLRKYGTPLVAACVAAGTHYCDLTGEVQWMARVIPQFQAAAESSGARIVHTCGFDSVPFDMGTWFLQQEMFARHGVYARQVKGRVGAIAAPPAAAPSPAS
ncbi:MAG: hypothetical protein R3E50_00260 [Halioglobus sp.]